MADLALAVQKALFDRLSAISGLGASVYQHVPDNQPPPVVIVGEDAITQEGGKGEQFERHEIDILAVIAGPQRKPLLAIQEKVRVALHDVALPPQPGADLSPPSLLDSIPAQLLEAEGGPIYFGTQRFLIFAQPSG